MTTPDGTLPTPTRWLREPLLHFFVAGALIFGIDTLIASRSDDPTLVTLNADADAELRRLFEEERGRAPTDAELAPLRQRWFDNELLYREGLALGLDRGDSTIRERVIFKALNVVQANLQPPTADEATMRAWFEQQRERYDEPARIDLLEAVMAGRPDRTEVQAFADALNQGTAETSRSGLRIFRGRPMRTIEASFGADFAAGLDDLPLNVWQAVDTPEGPRALMVESRTAGKPAEFDAMRDRVRADWLDRRMAELRTEAVRALGAKYEMRVAGEGVQ